MFLKDPGQVSNSSVRDLLPAQTTNPGKIRSSQFVSPLNATNLFSVPNLYKLHSKFTDTLWHNCLVILILADTTNPLEQPCLPTF